MYMYVNVFKKILVQALEKTLDVGYKEIGNICCNGHIIIKAVFCPCVLIIRPNYTQVICVMKQNCYKGIKPIYTENLYCC